MTELSLSPADQLVSLGNCLSLTIKLTLVLSQQFEYLDEKQPVSLTTVLYNIN